MRIPNEVEEDIGELIRTIHSLGAEVTDARYDAQSFGNYEVSFHTPKVAFRITRDRSQYMIHGPERRQLEQAGLWRAFDRRIEFEETLLEWLRSFAA
jgi:hypothetical protein